MTRLMDVGPVLDLEDVAGSKVCALAGRAYSRDYVDRGSPSSSSSSGACTVHIARSELPAISSPLCKAAVNRERTRDTGLP